MTETTPLIYLVDDDADVRTALSRTLGMRGYHVSAFADAKSFLNDFDQYQPSCLVLDYGLPDMDGLELQETLIAHDAILPIIFITGHGGVPESVKATRAGAVDFLEKPFSISVLLQRIEAALDLSLQLHSERHERDELNTRLATLTARETEVLEFVLSNPGRVSSKEIALALEISPRTVDIHRARLMQKMGVKSFPELVHICMIP